MAVAMMMGVTASVSAPIARWAHGTPSTSLVGARTYVVKPGDTLWSIASASAPDRDPRVTLAEIGSANDMGATLVPGQVLVIPKIG